MAKLISILLFCLFPAASALACGGFFCNSATPVNQAAERILFATDGDHMEMHVQITYQGPAIGFGWLLPAPPGVETDVSTEALFTRLDQAFSPRFRVATEYVDGCEPIEYSDASAAFGGGGDAGQSGPSVNVLSREAVGPYDRVILQADNVQVLFEWLEANDFAFPRDAAEKLEPYIENHVFVALKLLPGNDSDDIKPLRLRFRGNQPAIPIRPTAVAAEPDMGIIVYVLGTGRAVAVNYRHVEINEGAITWEDRGQNYVDVVSHAVDEAGGKAFVTEFGGAHRGRVDEFELGFELDDLRAVRTLEDLMPYARLLRSPDLINLVRAAVMAPEGADVDDVLRRPFDYDAENIPVDGEGLAQRIEDEILPIYGQLNMLFARHPDLTRLFSTMSADEMDLDPVFDLNVDLPNVDNRHVARMVVGCDDQGYADERNALVITPSGLRYRLVNGQNPHAIIRQMGETVRGMEETGAALIEQQMPAGQPQPQTDNRERLAMEFQGAGDGPRPDMDGGPSGGGGGGGGGGARGTSDAGGASQGGGGSGGGCSCDIKGDGPMPWALAALLVCIGLGRRRRH